MTKTPDPVSVLWERAAAAHLRQVYAHKGRWYATRITDPRPEHLTYFLGMWGIDVTGIDNAGTISGRHQNYRTRWNRAYVRAVYRVNRKSMGNRPIEVQMGRPKPAIPGKVRAGWAVRLRLRPSGRSLERGLARKAEIDRVWTDDGQRGGRFSDQNWDWL